MMVLLVAAYPYHLSMSWIAWCPLFFMLTRALMKGSGMHIINVMNNESGHQAIQDIETWYGSAATSRTIINHYRS